MISFMGTRKAVNGLLFLEMEKRMKLFGMVFRDCYLSRSLIDESETQQKSP